MTIVPNEARGGRRLWQTLTNGWTVLYIAFVVANFFSGDAWHFLTVPLSTLYIGVLGIYVGTKEFERWYENYRGARRGELFVAVFTALIVGLFAVSFVVDGAYVVPADVVASYIAVLSIFAITQKSKELHDRKMREKG
ncbi:MAG: hypothetical protein AAB601_01765 [Patescibacteria group bacterium]